MNHYDMFYERPPVKNSWLWMAVPVGLVVLALPLMLQAGTIIATWNHGRPSSAMLGTFRTTNLDVDENVVIGAQGSGQIQFGPVSPAADQKMLITQDSPDDTAQLWVQSDDTNHVGALGNNEQINVVLRNDTTFDTSANAAHASGIDVIVDSTIATGSNPLENIAIAANASCPGGNCQAFSWRSQFGTMQNDGPVNFASSPDVQLGQHVQQFAVVPATPTTSTPQLDVGRAFSVDGYNIHTVNTATGVANGGLFIQLDPTVTSGIRGGLTVDRSASVGANNAGIIIAGGSGDPWISSLANEWSMYSEIGPIVFGTDQSFTNSDMRLSVKGHWIEDISHGSPTLDAGCTAGGSSSIVGNDNAFKLITGASSTTCTLTFRNTWTLPPICLVTTEGGVALPTYTISPTALTFTTNLSAKTYNTYCVGQPSST